jgi:predicted nuclease of restriction endonuclease-like (RecB) superfamily
MKGFSPRNLKYMRAFADAWPDGEFVQAVLAQLPWYHQLALLDKLPGPEARRWYAAKAIEHNWSRNVLVMQIETRLLERSGHAVTNFPATLPAPQSDLARESIKDPYRFDFLGLSDEAQERDIENALVRPVTEFLLELAAGFAFVGRQVLLDVGGDEFFIELLFCHLKLRCYLVIELKGGKFKPEHLGHLAQQGTAGQGSRRLHALGRRRQTMRRAEPARQPRREPELALRDGAGRLQWAEQAWSAPGSALLAALAAATRPVHESNVGATDRLARDDFHLKISTPRAPPHHDRPRRKHGIPGTSPPIGSAGLRVLLVGDRCPVAA